MTVSFCAVIPSNTPSRSLKSDWSFFREDIDDSNRQSVDCDYIPDEFVQGDTVWEPVVVHICRHWK